MAKQKTYVGVDVGHSVVRVVMIAKQDSGQFVVVGVGESKSQGIRKGGIFDVDLLSKSLISAIEQAERMAGEPVEQAFVAIPSILTSSLVADGVVAVSRPDGEIDKVDIDRVLQSSVAGVINNNYEVLSNSPLYFNVDHNTGIKKPIGMTGVRLEARTHVIYVLSQSLKQIIGSILHAGVDVLDRTPAILAASYASLTNKQKELGCALIDLGASSTTIAVFVDGTIVYTETLPIGCDYITNDIAIGLKVSQEIAEKLKIEYGTCYPDDVSPRDAIDLSAFSSQTNHVVSRRELVEIIEARISEIFEMIKKSLIEADYLGKLPAGLVLTGGGSKLPGIIDYSREVVGLPSQYGFPSEFLGLADKVDDPSFASAVGLIIEGSSRPHRATFGNFSFKDILKNVQNWYQNIIQGHK